MTIDQLITELQRLKEEGVSGDTKVVHGETSKRNVFKYEELICLQERLVKNKSSLIQLVTI